MIDGLPTGWKTIALSKMADINPRHPKGLNDSMPVSFAPMAVVSESGPEFVSLDERPLGEVRKGFTHFAEGDVLFAKITPCMENGKGAVATGLRNGLGCGTTELHVIRPLAGIDPYYLYRFLSQRSIRRAAKGNFTGTAGQLRVPSVFIEELEVPLAPLNEQRRIVAKLEKLLGTVDACQQRLKKIPVILKRFRQSVLAAACSGRLTADWRGEHGAHREPDGVHIERSAATCTEILPSEWVCSTLGGFICAMQNGVSKRSSEVGDYTVVLRLSDVGNGTILSSDKREIRLTPQEKSKYGLSPQDILVVRVNGSRDIVGSFVLYKGQRDWTYCDHFIRLQVDAKTLYAKFLVLVSQSNDVRLHITRNMVSSAGQNTINHETLRSMPIVVPPPEEQKEIVRRTEALFALADQIEAHFATAKARVDQLTQSILAKTFRGELVPQDPNDEPASVLLERIKAERTKGKTEVKGGGKKRLNVNRKGKGR